MVKKLANEFIKNVKIMFRNWASLSLLIIAPLVFILLIGYAFSSDELKGINIGVYSDKNINLSLLSEGVKKYGTIKEYNNLQQCLSDLTLQKMHVCIHIEGAPFERNFQGNNIETAKITYYYDETRKKVSLSIIRNVKEFFGLKAEEMSIESTESIIEGIQNLIGFINERRNEINQLRNEAMQLRDEQIERKIKLEKVRSDFLPPYMLIKETQANMHNYSLRANKTSEEIKEDINRTIVLVREIKNTAIILLPPKLEEVGINETVNITNMTAITMLLEGIEKDLIILQNITDNATSDANSLVAEVDGIVKRIDTIKIMLDDEIARADASIAEIDKRVAQIEQISKELDEKLSGLAILEPGMAEKLIKPLIHNYGSILKDAKNIQLSFPQLLVLIIMFIALLFSNIATLTEINDKAYTRNLISPVNDLLFTVGMFITSIFIIFLQILVLFAVAQVKFHINITEILWQISAISLMLISAFTSIGMIFAYLFRSTQSSVLVTTFSALIFFLFSNTLAPIEAMPPIAKFLSYHNPIVIGELLIKEVQLFNIPLILLASKIILLGAYVIILFISLLILAKIKNRRRE